MQIELDVARRKYLRAQLQGFFLDELDQELSDFRAETLLEFVLGALGPEVYNQAVQDARKYMQDKLDDLEAIVFVEPS